jgi:hypothetical protein
MLAPQYKTSQEPGFSPVKKAGKHFPVQAGIKTSSAWGIATIVNGVWPPISPSIQTSCSGGFFQLVDLL